MEMNLCSLERLWKAWLTGTSLSEASKHADDGSNKRQWNGTEGEAGMAEIGRGLLRPGPWKSDWIGRSDVVTVGSSRRMRIRWCLGVPFSEWRSRSGTLASLSGRSGMKYDWPDGQQHSHVSSVLQSHHPFHRVLHSHLTQKMDRILPTCSIQPLLSSIFFPPLTSSSSLRVSSSMRRMSSMFKSIHLSIQQNSWRWKLVNRRFSCWSLKKKKKRRKGKSCGLKERRFTCKQLSQNQQRPSGWSSPLCFAGPTTWIWQWPVCTRTCGGSLSWHGAPSAGVKTRQTRLATLAWCCWKQRQQNQTRYLPVFSQGAPPCLHWLVPAGVLFWLIVLGRCSKVQHERGGDRSLQNSKNSIITLGSTWLLSAMSM